MPAPANDNWANATVISGTGGTTDGTTVDATNDFPPSEPFSAGPNVWYKWTAPGTGRVTFDTLLMSGAGVISDTTLAVFTGASLAGLSLVASNDDAQYLNNTTDRSLVSFNATAGTDYYIEVEGYTNGAFRLRWAAVPASYTTTARTEWKIGLFDKEAHPIFSTDFDGSGSSEFLKHPTDCRLTYTLNGIDQLEFSLLLDDPAALNIHKKTTYVRLWRFINDVENSKTRTPPWATPDFCGVVTGIRKSGEANRMTVTVQSVLWLVQCHFHIQNHRLVYDFTPVPSYNDGGNLNGLKWDHSALMWRLIDLINGAYRYTGGDTGIRKPPTRDYSGSGYLAGLDLFWPQTIQVAPFYVQKASYTWPLIYDDLLARDGSPDLAPEYIYKPGYIDNMYFKTEITRGNDVTATVSFDYRTGSKNIEDVEEESLVIPGEYANYIAVSGDGGPNSNLYTVATDSTSISQNGLFMKSENIPGTKLSDVQQVANSMIKSAPQADDPIYRVTMSPATPLYYDLDYTLGDLISLNADKGALQAEDVPQRIYQVSLSWSDNNVESTEVMISSDFKRKFI